MNAAPKTPGPRSKKRKRSPEFVRTAKALLLRQRTKEAINLLRRGLNLDPTCSQAALLLSKCLVAAKRLKEARLTLEKLVDREESQEAYVLLVRVCATLKDHPAAIDVARRALALYPDEPRLKDLQNQSRLELAELLEDTTERDGEAPDPEDLPTTRMPESRRQPFLNLLEEAGATAPSDTVPMVGTALTLPPVPEELSTSPNYRQAGDGALEDPLVVVEDQRSDRTPTPMPSDDLDFDRAPGAPDMISAVKQLLHGVSDSSADKDRRRRRLFGTLLGTGGPSIEPSGQARPKLRVLPPIEQELEPSAGGDDPDHLGGPTPADTPGAKQRARGGEPHLECGPSARIDQRERQRSVTPARPRPEAIPPMPAADSAASSRAPQPHPGAPQQGREGVPQPHPGAPRQGREDRHARAAPQGREDRNPAPPQATRRPGDPTLDLRGGSAPRRPQSHLVRLTDPTGRGREHRIDDSRVALPVGGELVNLDSPLPQVTMPSPKAPKVLLGTGFVAKALPAPGRPVMPSFAVVAVEEESSLLSRWWPLWLTFALLVIGSSTVAGLMVRQRSQVTRNLTRARALAQQHRVGPLKRALYHIREAANIGGRTPQMVALAAAIHAELTYEFGESTPRGATSLVEEATRLEADQLPVARDDLAVAQAYLQLARQPLPEALGYLLKSMERQPANPRLKLLYGRTLILNGELDLARRVLEELPADDVEVLQARAQLYWRSGHRNLAIRLLHLARSFGLQEQLADVEQARFETLDGEAGPKTILRLQQALGPALPRRQTAWAHLLLALIHNQQRHHMKTSAALRQALAHQPVADAEFSYWAGYLSLALHRLDAALRLARRSCDIVPRIPRYNTLQAAVELAMDRPAAVIERLSQSSDLTVDARLLLARALVDTGALDRAQELLGQLPRDAANARKQLVLARLHLAANRPYRALRELGAIDGQEVEAQVIRGLVALGVGDSAGTVRWMRSALKKDPLQADALWALGIVARRQADARHALEYLMQAVKANPYLRRARLDLGRLQLRMGNNAGAQRQFDEVLLLDASNLPGLVGRARASVEQGSKEAPLYIRALRVRGHSTLAMMLEARLQMVQGEPNAAGRSLRRLLRKRGLEHRREVLLWLADTEHRLGDLTHASILYRQSVAIAGRGPAPAAKLGLSEISLKRDGLASALRHGLAAAEDLASGIFPLSLRASIGVQLARCYRQGDALGAAIAELQDVLELDRANLEANLELGQIYVSLNKRDRAVQHLAQVLEVDRRNVVAQRELIRVCQDMSPVPADCRRK